MAPDKFAGTLTAVEAAAAIATGWRRGSRDAELVEVPMSDGGPGFVDVLHAALGRRACSAATVPDPYGAPVPATVLRVGDDGVPGERAGSRPAPHAPADRAGR